MHRYLFEIPLPGGGTFRLPAYGFMILVGFLVCLWLLQRRGRRMGLNPLALFDLAVWVLLGGLAGARIFYVIHHWSDFSDRLWHVFFLWEGGLAFFGGLIGGGLGLVMLVLSRRKPPVRLRALPLRRTLDVTASLGPLGHAFGRVGCFLNGCCYGKPTDAWVGVKFPELPRPVHPTQLYAVGYNLVIFALLSYLLPRRRRPGEVAWLYLVLYGTARYINEFFRGDPDTRPLPELGGLTVFQVLCLGAVLFGLVMLVLSRRKPPVPLPEPWTPPEEGG